jgi:hypothetical protein
MQRVYSSPSTLALGLDVLRDLVSIVVVSREDVVMLFLVDDMCLRWRTDRVL